MPDRRAAAVVAVLVLVAGLAPAVVMGGTGDGLTDARAHAFPPTPGEASTHRIQVDVGPGMAGETLSEVVVDYGGTDVSLADTTYQDLSARVVHDPGTENATTDDLPAAIYSSNATTVSIDAAGNLVLDEGDRIEVTIDRVSNPDTVGRRSVAITVRGHDRAATATADLRIEYPPPSLSDQGMVGSVHRIAITSPRGSGGFVVATTADGTVVGVTDLPEDQAITMDVGIDALVSADVPVTADLTLTAYRDTNGDGEYTPGTDEAWTRDGEPVAMTVADALAVTTTVPTTETTETSTTAPTTTRTTESTTRTSTSGFGIGAVVLSCLGVALLRRA